MAQNITLLGASYSNVPAVQLPKTGGGTARFDDASVTTATAADVASGKIFLAANGTITTGTNSGGGGSSKNTQVAEGCYRASSSSYTDTGMQIEVAKAGTYNILWAGYRSSTSGTSGVQVYRNGSTLGSAVTSFDSSWTNVQKGKLASQTLSAGDKITLRARSRGNNYYMYVWNLSIVEV